MMYTEHGLRIGLDELELLLIQARNEAKYHDMEGHIYIKGGAKPAIIQYSNYAECNPKNFTSGVMSQIARDYVDEKHRQDGE